MHVVDTTLFFSPTSGGVKRYLMAKHAWYASQPFMRHSLLVPGDDMHFEPHGVSTLSGTRVPGTFNYRLPLAPLRWSRMLEELEPDLIEAGDAFHPAWCAFRVAQRRRIPAVAFYHSNMPQLIGRRVGTHIERGAVRYARWLYSHFDAVYAPSRHMCEYLGRLGIPRVTCQPLGVDTEVFHPSRRTLDVRRELGLREDTRVLVFAGRFAGEKNLPVLFSAFEQLGNRYHLLVIGGGEQRQFAANITAIPYRCESIELARWMASCDALVHAGTKETFGLVLVEAMACGRPVIGTNAAAVPEIVDESVGQLARPHDSASFARAISDLYDRDLEQVGAAARARAVQHFSWAQAFQTQLVSYASLGVRVRAPALARQPVHEYH